MFWTACLSLVAAYYFQAGFNKATLPSWVSSNVLANFIFASHVGGWFYSHDSETALRALNMIRLANPLMIATTLIIELGSVFILSNRRVALALLAGFMLLHSLIFMLMGILFWKWLCMDACLLIVVWRMKAPLAMELFSRKNFGFGVATTAGILIFMQPWGQGSLNTPLAATYRFEAVGESGERYSLSSDFFAPYDVIFAQRRFYCLSDQAPVVSTFGSTKNPSLFREIGQAGPDAVQIAKIIDDAQTNGNAESTEDAANPQLAAQFDQFVTRFVQAKLNAGESAIAERIGPFHHILQSPGGEGLAPYDWQEPIARVDVYEVQKFYDTQAIHTLKDQLCHQVEVGSADEFVARVRQQPSEVRPR